MASQLASDPSEGISDVAQTTKENIPSDISLSSLEGLQVGEGGKVLDKAGKALGNITKGRPEDLVGHTVGNDGKIIDDDGDVIGRVQPIGQEAADKLGEQASSAETVKGNVPSDLSFSSLKGLQVSEGGKVLDKTGKALGDITEGHPEDLVGHTIGDNGKITDDGGNVIGRVQPIGQEAVDKLGEQASSAQEATTKDLSILNDHQVNEDGQVLDSTGKLLGELKSGNLADVSGKTVNSQGLVLDEDGNIKGRVSLAGDVAQATEDALPLPPLSTLSGLKVNKLGKIVNDKGSPIGELVEGDPKKLSKLGVTADEQGQFWDNRGNVIGKAQTVPVEEAGEEGPFAGLSGLNVVQDGWVEEENGRRVGKLVEGDAKKLIGRAVDEDGDILDNHGNSVGRAEQYEEPDAPEPTKMDFSDLAGLTPNKNGNVIGPEGVPVARLVEGKPKELAGRKIDNEGQIWNDAGKVVGRVEFIPEEERETKPEGVFGEFNGLVVNKDSLVEDEAGNVVGKIIEGDPSQLHGRPVDEDGDIVDKYGNVKGRAERYEPPEEEPPEEEDLSSLEGKKINKAGNVVDEHGVVLGRITGGDPKKLAGRGVDAKGQIWSDDGKVIGRAELIPGAEREKPEGPFFGQVDAKVGKDGVVVNGTGEIIGRLIEGDAKRLQDRAVDEDGDVLDKAGNIIGKAERWEPEEKPRDTSPMAGRKVNKEGEVRDENGDLIGKVTDGNVNNLVGKTIDDNGYVVDNDGNKIGEATLLENLPAEEPDELSPEEAKKLQEAEEDRKLADQMCKIVRDTIGKVEPVCKQITSLIEKADRTPTEELDEEKLVQDVKPLLEEGGRILQECNGAIRALDPDGRIAETAKARAATHEATPEEYRLADLLKELTQTVVQTIDNGRKRIQDMPHAKKELNPLWSLLSEPLFQIISAVGLLLSGVLGLVSRLLDGLGLGGLVRGLLGGLGVDKLLEGLGLGTISESLGFNKR